jgi:hypothetical protein
VSDKVSGGGSSKRYRITRDPGFESSCSAVAPWRASLSLWSSTNPSDVRAEEAGELFARLLAIEPDDVGAYEALLEQLYQHGLKRSISAKEAARAKVAAELAARLTIAILSPNDERWSSLERALHIVRTRGSSIEEQKARAVLAVKLRRSNDDISAGGRELWLAHAVRGCIDDLSNVDAAFDKLEPDLVAEHLSSKHTSIAARLAVASGAFGCEQKLGETEFLAGNRHEKAFRLAWESWVVRLVEDEEVVPFYWPPGVCPPARSSRRRSRSRSRLSPSSLRCPSCSPSSTSKPSSPSPRGLPRNDPCAGLPRVGNETRQTPPRRPRRLRGMAAFSGGVGRGERARKRRRVGRRRGRQRPRRDRSLPRRPAEGENAIKRAQSARSRSSSGCAGHARGDLTSDDVRAHSFHG